MTDPRIKDSIRMTEKKVDDLTEKVETMEEMMGEILKTMRSIKESVVRKYGKDGK